MLARTLRYALLPGLLLAALARPAATGAEIAAADLIPVRTVTERDWLDLRLQVLGLRLSYPAYRVHLELQEVESEPAAVSVAYTFWLSAAMSDHLMDAGRTETERVLRYHARGISAQVSDLVRDEFVELWPGFDADEDVLGRFLTPGAEVDEAPLEVARWRAGQLKWTRGR